MLIQDQLASIEAVVGRLPAGTRIIQSAALHLILEIQLSFTPARVQRICVLFDNDRDLRVLWVVGALAMFSRFACENLVAVAESGGKLRSWWITPIPMLPGADIKSLQHASDVALAPDDEWIVEPPTYVKMKSDGTADLDSLPENDPLRTVSLRDADGNKVLLGRVLR